MSQVITERTTGTDEDILRQHENFISREEINPTMTAIMEAGMERFEQLGFPKRKHEMFTYVDTASVVSGGLKFGAPNVNINADDIKRHIPPDSARSVVVIVNGVFSRELSDVSALAHAIKIKPCGQAAGDPEVRSILLDAAKRENDVFAALNAAFGADGVMIEIGAGFRIDFPLQIIYYSTISNRAVTSPRVIVRANKFSEFALAVKFTGENGDYFVNAAQDIILEEGAAIKYYHMQSDAADAVNFTKSRFIMSGNSRVFAVTAYSGCKLARHSIDTRMRDEGAEFSLNSLSVLNGKSAAHSYVRIHHEAPNCASDQLFRNIVMDKSHSSVDGTVTVREGAVQSRSSQLINNLMLSGGARADTKPNLMIYNDDVKCSHGATVGRADEEQLFYLRSRGLARSKAVAALTTGFAGKIVDLIKHRAFADDVNDTLLSKLEW